MLIGLPGLISEPASAVLAREATKANERFRCYMCLTEMEPGKARGHVGVHILKAMRGITEELEGEQVSKLFELQATRKMPDTCPSSLFGYRSATSRHVDSADAWD